MPEIAKKIVPRTIFEALSNLYKNTLAELWENLVF
jgi:hypothetical protein